MSDLNTSHFTDDEMKIFKKIKKFEKLALKALPKDSKAGITLTVDHKANSKDKGPLHDKSEFTIRVEVLRDAEEFGKALDEYVDKVTQEFEEKKEEAEKKAQEIADNREKAMKDNDIKEGDLNGTTIETAVFGCDGELLSAKVLGKDGEIFRLKADKNGKVIPSRLI